MEIYKILKTDTIEEMEEKVNAMILQVAVDDRRWVVWEKLIVTWKGSGSHFHYHQVMARRPQ